MKNLFAKLLPGFTPKPAQTKLSPALTGTAPQPTQPAPEPESSEPEKPPKLLDQISAFLARYLQCSEQQRIVLALWVLHTHCFSSARATPYLAIQSSRKLSGKTLCLRLLSLLCSNSALTSGYTAAALVNRIHSQAGNPPTFLLDESPATLGSRRRPKSPKLHAILSSGFQLGIGYTDRASERIIFSPKAFAITGKLPESLSDRSIPIVLHPLRPKDQGSEVERFDLLRAQQEIAPIVAAIQKWSKKNLSALKTMSAYKRQDFPAEFSERTQDMVEPLLHLADALGGDCPAIARRVLLAVFKDQEKQQREESTQLLSAIFRAFEHHGSPDRLPTADLLLWLNSLPDHPWEAVGPINAPGLARLLRPLGIHPRLQRIGKSSPARGYQKQDFAKAWSEAGVAPPPARQEISNNGVPCNTVTHVGAIPDSGSVSANQGLESGVQIDPRLKGILEDPRNYYRQYPEEHRLAVEHCVDDHYWPIPADDHNRPGHYTIMTTNDGYSAPLCCINQFPWDANKPRPRNFPEKSPRFPITFTREERIQVAVARLHEIELGARAGKPKPLRDGYVPAKLESGLSSAPRSRARTAVELSATASGVHAGSATSSVSSSSHAAATTGLESGVPGMRAVFARAGVEGNTVTPGETDLRLKGLLADPRNFYRQYPDEHKAWLKEHLNKQFWPIPADDEGELDYLSVLPDGSPMPFTFVNRPPWTTPRPPAGVSPSSPRFPITLSDKEKLQVAVARLYEIRQVQDRNRARHDWELAAKRELNRRGL
jgi:hypothetical protein